MGREPGGELPRQRLYRTPQLVQLGPPGEEEVDGVRRPRDGAACDRVPALPLRDAPPGLGRDPLAELLDPAPDLVVEQPLGELGVLRPGGCPEPLPYAGQECLGA